MEQAALGGLAQGRHRREPVEAAAAREAQQERLGLVIEMMRGQEMEAAGVAAP